jgi:hypothetical protein
VGELPTDPSSSDSDEATIQHRAVLEARRLTEEADRSAEVESEAQVGPSVGDRLKAETRIAIQLMLYEAAEAHDEAPTEESIDRIQSLRLDLATASTLQPGDLDEPPR